MLRLKTYLRANRKDKKGESIIYFIVADEWISTGLKLNCNYWEQKTETISKKHPSYYVINPCLQQLKSRAEQCIGNLQISQQQFNRQFFETFIFEGSEAASNPSFFKLIDLYTTDKRLSYARIKHYNELKKDIGAINLHTKIQNINHSFTDKLQSYLAKKGNCENTIIRKLKQIKAVVHYCQILGYLKSDPLALVKLKEIKGNKEFLTHAELQHLEQLHASNTLYGLQQNVLTYFLFSCYTGLRYSDVIQLKSENIINNTVCATQEKTNKPVYVPLIKNAANLINTTITGKCFTTHASQVSNKALKKIMQIVGIHKNITFHCSRHTFGTLSITFGIPMEVVAELMGVDFKTVKVYAKIVNDVKLHEMQKWEIKTA